MAEQDAPVATYGDDDNVEPMPRAPRVAASGGTLFERMSNLSRGVSKADDEDEDDGEEDAAPLNIPRFLGRQNNQ